MNIIPRLEDLGSSSAQLLTRSKEQRTTGREISPQFRASDTADIDLRHLRYFLTVAHEGTISRAARSLHTSQPSLGKQIHDLERRVGATLFKRENNKMLLTEPGQLFFERASKLLENWSRWIDETSRRCKSPASQLIRILTSEPVAASEVFATFLCDLRKHDDEVPIQVIDPAEDPALYRLMDGDVDFLCTLSAPQNKELEVLTICRYGVYALLPPGHPRVDARSIAASEIGRGPEIILGGEQYPHFNGIRSRVFPRRGTGKSDSRIEIGRISTALDLVSQGEGFMLSFGLTYPKLNRKFGSVRIKGVESVPLQLCWRRKSSITARSELLHFLRHRSCPEAES